jgi:EmrB/QacA subfamily drug resistance transporter
MTTMTVSAPDRAGTGRHLGMALLVIATAQLMVVLDATIVTVALPHIQNALGFSGSGLEWVVNAYVLTLGGLLLLGGRAGDLFGRRRMFSIGLLLFSAASLAGGLATTQAWLLTARTVQGIGGAIVAPTALSLVATTFPQGPARNRAMGVYSAMSVAGGVIGLVVGGLLVTYASWRWVLFVNVPVGIAAAFGALAVLPGVPSRPGRFDMLGAVTGTAGMAALVYGLSQADNGTSHWGNANVIAALAGGVVLLAAFAVIETRSRHALLPVRLLRNSGRVGANLIMLGVGAAVGGVFFFLTLYVQDVWGYSPLRTGVSFLPFTAVMLAATVAATKLVSRVGPRPLLIAGALLSAGGLYWLSLLTSHGTYPGGLLGPALIIGAGLGLMFLPLSLVSLAGVAEVDSGGRRQPAQYRPSGRRLHRPRGAGHRGLDGRGPPRPLGRGGPGGLARAAQVGSDLPVRADGRLRPGLPGRRRDLRAHARGRRHRGPRPPRRPGRPLAAGRSQVEDQVLARLRAADQGVAVGGVIDRVGGIADRSGYDGGLAGVAHPGAA